MEEGAWREIWSWLLCLRALECGCDVEGVIRTMEGAGLVTHIALYDGEYLYIEVRPSSTHALSDLPGAGESTSSVRKGLAFALVRIIDRAIRAWWQLSPTNPLPPLAAHVAGRAFETVLGVWFDWAISRVDRWS